jgi:hypothetical protein
VVSAVCSAGFLVTRVGQLAALDQQVRQLESFGAIVTDDTYAELRQLVPYRPIIDAAFIVIGWPILWVVVATLLHAVCERAISLPRRPDEDSARSRAPRAAAARGTGRREQVLTIVVHASAIFALRAIVAAPINYARESLGGATSLSMVMPAFSASTFPARLLGAVDIFILWWVVLVALGLSILYQTRTLPIARWLFGAYAGGAATIALTQALRGGI